MSETLNRDAVNSLLVKTGMEEAAVKKLSTERATKKLKDRLQPASKGIPAELTPSERETVTALGFAPAPEKAPEVEAPYELAGVPGVADKVELMTPTKASARNAGRTDGHKWVPAPGKEPTPKATTPAPTAPVIDAKTGVAETKAPAAAPKPKTVKPGETKGNAPDKTKGQRGGVTQTFIELFKGNSPIKKTDVMHRLLAAGLSESSAMSYLTWAKRDPKDIMKNDFGFRLEEFKVPAEPKEGEEQEKFLKVVERVDLAALLATAKAAADAKKAAATPAPAPAAEAKTEAPAAAAPTAA